MSLAPGTRLGAYEILAAIGAGGMGEVYRARDTKLGRDVALKLLPESFASDPDRVARFKREAQVLAALNHPNIAHIHGFEDSTGVPALVLELVDGPTLAERIARGPIPIDEALPIARQLAEALDAAHQQGIIHRDLKPANIKLRDDGAVKVLDFGLAKALEPSDGSRAGSGAVGMTSPTITTPAMMTGVGMILGTAAYMSPEQAKGRPTDKRSDLWAFGCVLYEMLTGARAFHAEDVSETLASVLRAEPAWTALPKNTPRNVRTLLAGALEKDRAKRIGDIAVVQFLLRDADTDTTPAFISSPSTRTLRGAVAALGVIAAVAIAAAVWVTSRQTPAPLRPTARFLFRLPAGVTLLNPSGYPSLALSPDGTRLVYAALAGAGTGRALFMRAIDQLEPTAIHGTEDGMRPFFSWDGKWIGFQTEMVLKKVPVAGGAAITICHVDADVTGAAWLPDDSIVFGAARGLSRVSAGGGTPARLTTPDGTTESAHRWPEALPDGKSILFTIGRASSYDDAAIGLLRLDSGERRVLVEGGMHAHYVQSGHLVFGRAGTIVAVPFDLSTLQVRGTPAPVLEGVFTSAQNGSVQLVVARTGSIAYVGITEVLGNRELVWVDRSGGTAALAAPRQGYEFPRLSPDGQRLAITISSGSSMGRRDIWIYDLVRGTLSRLTFEKDEAETPVWTPDGRRVAFATNRIEAGRPTRSVFWKPIDGSQNEKLLASSDHHLHLGGWSPKGDFLISGTTEGRLWGVKMDDPPTLIPLLTSSFQIRAPAISPDGVWVAYASNETQRFEVYVQALASRGGKHQVSNDGGTEPVWAKNGRELFFRNGDKMMGASISSKGDLLEAGKPHALFERKFATVNNPSGDAWYDVSPDGQRFLMLKTDDTGGASSIVIVQDWLTELKSRVAAK